MSPGRDDFAVGLVEERGVPKRQERVEGIFQSESFSREALLGFCAERFEEAVFAYWVGGTDDVVEEFVDLAQTAELGWWQLEEDSLSELGDEEGAVEAGCLCLFFVVLNLIDAGWCWDVLLDFDFVLWFCGHCCRA